MTKPRYHFAPRSLLIFAVLILAYFGLAGCAYGQLMYTDLESHVDGLPALHARTHDPSDVLAAALATIVNDHEVCCGKDSALEDSLERADPQSLKDVVAKVQGRHLLSDGRPIAVSAEFWPTEIVDGLRLVNAFSNKHAVLMMWNSHVYVVYGVLYRWVEYSADAGPYTVIRKMELIDPRYSDERREVEFNRESDDPAKVQGFLFLAFSPQ